MSKPVSLKELGYTIKAEKGHDAKGNEFVFKVTGPAPVFFFKMTKRGRLVAVKSKDSNSESTIEGLFNFKVEGDDLVGQRAPSVAKPATAEAPAEASQDAPVSA